MKSPIKTALLSIILSFAMTLVMAADVATCTTESPLTVFTDSGKYGYKNEAGEVVIEARYDEADPFEGGYAIVMSGGKYGVINTSGNCVVDCVYDGVTCLKTESVPRYQSANKQVVIDVALYFKVVRNGGGDVVVLKSSLNHDVEPFVIGEYRVMLMDNICYVFDFMGMLTTKVWYDNVEVEYDGHLLVLSKGNKSFVISKSSIMADNMAYYDAVEQMECGLYVTRNNNRYGIVSVDGRELAQPEMLHVDLKANGWCWLCNERGECFYLSIPEDVANAEVMTLAQYKERNGNPWDNDYSYNNPKAVTGKSLTKCIGFEQFSDWDQKEYEVNIGEDTYPHRLLYDIVKWGDKRIVVVRHCLNGENYIYIERGGKVISELAYSQISACAFEYIARIDNLKLCSFQQLANGDLLIESKANVVDFYCDGASDISYCLASGEWCDLSNIISDNGYYGYNRFDCRLCFVLDAETFELKDCTILDEDYRVLGVSAYDGWYASSGGGWQSFTDYNSRQAYEHLNISHGAVVRLSNEGGFQGVYTVGEGERFMNIFETESAVFFGGVTKNRGYITKDNPCVWVHNRDTWVPIWVESYSCLSDEECFAADDCVDFRHWKLNGGVVNHLRFDKGKIVCYETKDSKTYQYKTDFADMEPESLRVVSAQHKDIWAYGLVNQFGNWVVPPVLPGDEPVSYGDWTIYPAEVYLDHGCVQTTYSAIIKYQGMYGRYVNDCWLFDPVYSTPDKIANIDSYVESSDEPQRIFIKKVGLDGKTLYGWMGWRGYDDVFVYPKYEDFGSESEGLRSVCLNGKWGWVDAYDNVVIPLIYDYYSDLCGEAWPGENSYYFWSDDWICMVWKDGKCGGINSKGEVVIPIIYDPEDFERTEDNGIILFKDPMYYYYSASGELLKTEERVAPIVNHKADVEVLEDVLTIVSNDTKIEVPQALYVEELTFDTIVFDVKPEEVVDTIVEEEVLFTVEEMPTFQGGDLSKFRSWVQSNVLYPQVAMENGIQGNVVVKFIIEKDGTLSNILVLQSPDQSLSDAVIQVLRKSPKWKPGKQRNKPVRVTFTLPVAFKLFQ